MPDHTSTCWTVIRDAAAGDRDARNRFAGRYEAVVRAYLKARWRDSLRRQDVDDAVQDVFAECFRAGGALDRVDPSRPGGFRAFLYGIIRVVALRFETRPRRRREEAPPQNVDLCEVPADDTRVSLAFDRAWARSLLREAAERQAELAARTGESAVRRVELLRLRFHDGLPIREIAQRFGCDPDAVHREYARARQEFKAALADVVLAQQPDGTPGEIERECAALLELFP
jgi:RNA polymerase sigma factor (sigma-70 family)